MLVSGISFSVSMNFSTGPPLGPAGNAEHAGELSDRDLDADAGEESDEHAPGQEVGDEPEPDHAGDDQEGAAIERHDAGQRDVLRRPGRRRPARPAAMIAAGAESAPTTRWRDEPRNANTAIGIRIV